MDQSVKTIFGFLLLTAFGYPFLVGKSHPENYSRAKTLYLIANSAICLGFLIFLLGFQWGSYAQVKSDGASSKALAENPFAPYASLMFLAWFWAYPAALEIYGIFSVAPALAKAKASLTGAGDLAQETKDD